MKLCHRELLVMFSTAAQGFLSTSYLSFQSQLLIVPFFSCLFIPVSMWVKQRTLFHPPITSWIEKEVVCLPVAEWGVEVCSKCVRPPQKHQGQCEKLWQMCLCCVTKPINITQAQIQLLDTSVHRHKNQIKLDFICASLLYSSKRINTPPLFCPLILDPSCLPSPVKTLPSFLLFHIMDFSCDIRKKNLLLYWLF